MTFPRYYTFDDGSLPGSVRVVFDDHIMHADNFREHVEGFINRADEDFTVHGQWREPNVLLYANGLPSRMRDGIVWLIQNDRKRLLAEWIAKTVWPTENTMSDGVVLPGRWLHEEEAARHWLSLQGVSGKIDRKTLESELKKRSVPFDRFKYTK